MEIKKRERIKGVNIGSRLLMEGYILGGRNIPESEFKHYFKKEKGKLLIFGTQIILLPIKE